MRGSEFETAGSLLSFTCLLILAGVALGGAWLGRSSSASPLQRGIAAYGRRIGFGREGRARAAQNPSRRSRSDAPAGTRVVSRGRAEPAMALFDRLGENMLEAEDLFLLGYNLLTSGKSNSAIQLWRKAVEKDPDHIKSLVALEQVCVQMDLLSEAAPVAEKLSNEPGWEARVI